MKRKYGFNFLWMYSFEPNNPTPREPDIDELDFIAEEGFNFVRIPTDYRFWTNSGDFTDVKEESLEFIDRYIEACNSRGLHACFNIHRGIGYCINWPEREKYNLWRDSEAQDGFVYQWNMFAKRYRGISAEKLSFDLINEPCSIPPTHPCTKEEHEKVIRRTVAEIRSVDPQREIVIDGFNGGGSALPELADLGKNGVVHSGRGYEPFKLTHYKAEWVRGGADWDMPSYPSEIGDRDSMRRYYEPWRQVEKQGVKIHIGEFGCYNKLLNDIALRWFDDLLSLYYEFGWGYSLWNFRGSFGIVEHGRPGTVYESYRGFNVDRELLRLLKKYRRED